MPFWSGETLLQQLPQLIAPFSWQNVDCAAYTLTIGHEIYVTPTEQVPGAQPTKQDLHDGEAFTIPPGQFAFLLTEERVTIPHDAIGFISIRARIKFRGLVNVSGFHVDPGFTGHLVFAVFNAGPSAIHLQQGQGLFLIWYASLDRLSEKVKASREQRGLSLELVNNIAKEELLSFRALDRRIDAVAVDLKERMAKIEVGHTRLMTAAAGIIALLTPLVVATTVQYCSGLSAARNPQAPALTAPASAPASVGGRGTSSPAPAAGAPGSTTGAVPPTGQGSPPPPARQSRPPSPP